MEQWLADCCDSLLAQTWHDWEAILLVDGSPDDSISIARRYEQLDSRFRVKEIENRGLGGARNAAVEISRGEYVFFMDSDDELTPRALEMLMSAAERTGADIAAGFGEDLFDGGIRRRYWTYGAAQFLRRPSTYTLERMPSLTDDHTAWGKLIRRDLIDREQLSFPEGVHCEDIVFSLRSQLAANRITIVTEPVYLHRRHGAAISADYLRVKTLGDWIVEARRTLEVIETAESARVRNHYVLNHTMRQWLTRALRFTDIPSPELLAGVEGLAAGMLRAADQEAVAALDSWQRTLLQVFAAGIPSSRWQSLRANPLQKLGTEGVDDGDFVHAVLEAAAALDETDPVEGHARASLLLSRLVLPAASGHPLPADSVLEDAHALLRAVPKQVLAGVDRPAVGEPGLRRPDTMDAAWSLLNDLCTASGTITEVRTTRSTVTVTGELVRAGDDCFTDRFSLVLAAENGAVATVPLTVNRDGDVLRWQGVVPAAVLGRGPQRLLLRRSTRYAPGAVEYRLSLAEGAVADAAVGIASADPAAIAFTAPQGGAVAGERVQGRVFTFPNWYSNPYLTMLHTEVVGGGMSAPGTVDPNRLMAELRDRRATGAIHIHWTSPLIEKRDSGAEADAFVDEFIAALRDARGRGRPVLWTVHNALPHDSRHPETAVRLHAELAQAADIIHVLSPSTVAAIEGVYELPAEKVRVLEHSSYQGIYGDRMPMPAARAAIGASASSRTALFFGQLRPYKGLDQLFDAAIQLQETSPVELLLAGKPAPELTAQLERIERSGVAVTAELRFIEDSEVASWFSAADVAVLPYRKVLNSGSMMLAASYGLPVILPDEPALTADFGSQPWIRFFDTTRPAESIAELLRQPWFEAPEVRGAALDFARGRSPVRMARGYLRMLEEAAAQV